MRHKLRINVSEKPGSESIMTLKNVSIREKLLRFLFGDKQKVTILIPGLQVDEVTVFEAEKGYVGNE